MRILYFDCTCGLEENSSLQALMDLGISEESVSTEYEKFYQVHFKSGKAFSEFDTFLKSIADTSLIEDVKVLANKITRRLLESVNKLRSKNIISDSPEAELNEKAIEYIIKISICISYLKPEKIMSTKIPSALGIKGVGGEETSTDILLKTELLKGIPMSAANSASGILTPICAAMLSSLVDDFTDDTDFVVEEIGYGMIQDSTYSKSKPLRIFLCKSDNKTEEGRFEHDRQFIIECNIDDMNPETYDYIMQKILKAGAADVFITPMIMKKGRPAIKLSVLCSGEKTAGFEEMLLRVTSTFGVRKYEVNRTMLKRNFSRITTTFGEVAVKNGMLDGKIIKSKPEYEECKALAEGNNVPISHVYAEAFRNILPPER